MTSARFVYSVVASPLHDRAAVEQIIAPIRTLAADLGGEPDAGEPSGPGRTARLVVVATGGTEQAILELVDRSGLGGASMPVLLLAHRSHNSLPAALEALAALHQQRRRGRIVHLCGDDAVDRDALDEAVGDLETVARLRSARLGLIGGPSSWLVASSPGGDVVQRRWGPTVEVVDPDRMIELTRTPVVPTGRLAERFLERSADRPAVERDAVEAAVGVAAALEDVVEDGGLDAVSVRCFDLLQDPGTSGCVALAELNDAGVVAGCEGDLPSTLGMLWVRYLLDRASWMANPARVDRRRNEVVLAHCTVAPSLTDGYTLDTHFESGRGVGISGRFADQPVTLVRIGGRDLEQCWIAEGDIVAHGSEPDLCRTQVTVALTDGSVDDLLERPLGNHLVMVAGHHADRLRRWWRLAIADPAPFA